MALNIEDKKKIVEELAEVAQSSIAAAAADYRGLTVAEMTALRSNARQASVCLRVVRNTLARRAMEDTDFSCMQDAMMGPLILAFSKEEPSAPARLFRDFAKENEKLKVKILSIGAKLLDSKELDAMAKLPTRDEALAQLMAVMKAPITKLVRTLSEPHAKLVRTMGAVRNQMQTA